MAKLILFVSILLIHSFSHTQVFSGKSYKAEISASCKEMTNGGCMIYTYRILKFEQDSVYVSFEIVPYCHPEEMNDSYDFLNDGSYQSYIWSLEKDKLVIEGFLDYGTLSLVENKLIGRKNKEVITFLLIDSSQKEND